jgi:hypothetical protein
MDLYLGIANLIVTLGSVIVGLIALVWGITWGVNSYNRQMNTQVFLTYTQRFEQVMESFPENAWVVRLDIDKLPEPSPELSRSVLKYLNLCAEEFYLLQKKLLAKEVWAIWEKELERTLQTPLFVREWEILAEEFEAYPEFQRYLKKIQAQAN